MSADPLAAPSASGSEARSRRPSQRWWTSGSGVPALWLWAGSRVSVLVFVLAAAQLTASGRPADFLDLWNRWDVSRLVFVARHGFFPEGALRAAAFTYEGEAHGGSVPWTVAYFPGQPLLLRAVHVVVGDWVAAGLLVSLVSGAIAVVALARLADLELPGLGPRAVLALVSAPFSVFLAAGYSEALFLACALWSWYFARRRVWWAAGLLGALAATTRITGVFLGMALAVEWLVSRRGATPHDSPGERPPARRPAAVTLLWTFLPWLSTGVYFAWLRWQTGSWTAWQQAQSLYWHRGFAMPWQALATTWHTATTSHHPAFAFTYTAEILAVLVGVGLTGALLAYRRWAEASYVGLQIVAFATSTQFYSVTRATLLWWPLWLLLATWTIRHPRLGYAYLGISAPLAAAVTLGFVTAHWVG